MMREFKSLKIMKIMKGNKDNWGGNLWIVQILT